MAKELSINDFKNYFHNKTDRKKEIENEKGKIFSFLRKKFSVSDDDLEDVYQESLSAFYLNIENGKLPDLSESYFTYFLKICTNQTLKLIRKNSKTLPLFDERSISNPNVIRDDKIDELYGVCFDTEEADQQIRIAKLANSILNSMNETCREIFDGYFWRNYSTSTLADWLGYKNADSVKAQKYKCLKKYQDKFMYLKNKIYG